MKTLALIALVTFGANAFLADVTGRWTGRINDQFDVAYDLKQEGEKLTGKTTGPDGNSIDITNGSVKGDEVSFTINIMGNDMPVKGKVTGDTMTLTMTFDGNPFSFDLKKEVK